MPRTNNVLSIGLTNTRSSSHKGHDDRHGQDMYDDANLEKEMAVWKGTSE